MASGYHSRYRKGHHTACSIDSADIVRLAHAGSSTDGVGVQLYAKPTPPLADEVVVRLTRGSKESETDFVKRAFHEAAARRPHVG